jgi:hypothetical protein
MGMEMGERTTKNFCTVRVFRTVTIEAFAIALFVAAVGSLFAAQAAQAQNLVQNPVFFDGLNGYESTGSLITTPATMTPGVNIAILAPGSILTQSIQTNINATYLVKFFTAIINPQTMRDVLFASFGDSAITIDSANGDMNSLYSFTATATGSNSTLRFAEDSGFTGITGLDVEAAPAPVPGAGGLSFLVGLAALAGVAVRRHKQGA